MKVNIESLWYQKNFLAFLLWPVSIIFRLVVWLRRKAYALGILKSHQLDVPVIVVGNITVGGTGKTPLVIWLVNYLKRQGWRPGVISRGYGGKAKTWPQQVRIDGDPYAVGDEPVLIRRKTDCPVVVGPDRVEDAKQLLAYHDCNIIVLDDGLQHYRLQRDIEIIVVDGVRRFGNKMLLPAGPLREPLSRLDSVDLVVTNGFAKRGEHPMKLSGLLLRNLADDRVENLADWRGRQVHLVAGIGNPERFFDGMRGAGVSGVEHAYPDHYAYGRIDLNFNDDLPVVMTEKDAVKWRRYATERHWYVPVEAEFQPVFEKRLQHFLDKLEPDNG